MANFKYQVAPVPGGWTVSCNGVAGPPYAERDTAVLDTLAILEQLRRDGHKVELRLFDMSGTGQLLEPADARLFTA